LKAICLRDWVSIAHVVDLVINRIRTSAPASVEVFLRLSGEFRMEGGFEEIPDSLGHLVKNHVHPSKQSEALSKELSDLLDEKIGQMEQRLTDLLNTPRKSD